MGDVNGYEPDFTGYGVYYPPIVAAAERYGATADGHIGWTITEIESELRLGNSVVVWLTSDSKRTPPATGPHGTEPGSHGRSASTPCR